MTKYAKLLDFMIVDGHYKYLIFFKKKFEVKIYFTPYKGIIIDIETSYKKIPFKPSDDIKIVRDWISVNNYEIQIEINRL